MFSNIAAAQKVGAKLAEEEINKRRGGSRGNDNNQKNHHNSKKSKGGGGGVVARGEFVLTSPSKREWMKHRHSSASFVGKKGGDLLWPSSSYDETNSTADSSTRDLSSSLLSNHMDSIREIMICACSNDGNDSSSSRALSIPSLDEGNEEKRKEITSSPSKAEAGGDDDDDDNEIMNEDEIALEEFKTLLEVGDLSCLETVKLLYTLGKLSVRLGNYEQALQYHQVELETTMTQLSKEIGMNESLEVAAKVLDGMAKIAKNGLSNASMAHQYYKAALKIRMNLYRTLMNEYKNEKNKNNIINNNNNNNKNNLQKRLLDVKFTIQETRRNVGRILFEEGHVDQAIRMIPQIGHVV